MAGYATPAERIASGLWASDADAVLRLAIPIPGQVPDRSVVLSCNGPDVLIHIDMLDDADVATWLAEGRAMTLLIDSVPVRFSLFDLAFDTYYGWVAAAYFDGAAGPEDWLDRLPGATSLVAVNPVDRFAFPATDDTRSALRRFAQACAATRFGLDPSAEAAVARAATGSPEGRAVFYEPTRLLRDTAWRRTTTTPGTVAWTLNGSGATTVLSATVAVPDAATAAAIAITPSRSDPGLLVVEIALSGERWRLGMTRIGIAGNDPSVLRSVERIADGRAGMHWTTSLTADGLRDLFAGPLIYLGHTDPLLDPSLLVESGAAGEAALAAAMAAWGMDR
ncbi:MAG: hypothetical protein KIT43_10460 [Bauldia sp.]|nr:hypothetical protein [Bauldia sp.]